MMTGITPSLLMATQPLSLVLHASPAWDHVSENIYSADASASVSGGVLPYGFVWTITPGNIESGQGTFGVLLSTGSGLPATVKVIVTDAAGEVVTASRVIAADPGG